MKFSFLPLPFLFCLIKATTKKPEKAPEKELTPEEKEEKRLAEVFYYLLIFSFSS